MDHIIKQIVADAFEKAKKGSASHKPHALSKYIEAETNDIINYKTAERAYKRYIFNNKKIGQPIPETIKNFCKYLGYEDFKGYVEKNEKDEPEIEVPRAIKELNLNPEEEEKSGENGKRILIVTIILSSVIVLFLYDYINNKKENKQPPIECMAWADNHYEKVDCDLPLHPKYGTKVESYSPKESKSMKKVDVNSATLFFSEETGKPLMWYYKTKEGTIEYFTAPGLHPVNRETLKKITEGIIEKYVPIHKTQPDSFILTDTVYSAK